MFASAICVRAGAASQAAFEIIRQAWIISIQVRRGSQEPRGWGLVCAVVQCFYIHMHCNTWHIMLGIYGLHARQSSARPVSEIRHAP